MSERIRVDNKTRLAYLYEVKAQRIAEVTEARRALGRAETRMSEAVLDVMYLESEMEREGDAMSDWPQFVTVYRVVGWSDEVCNLGMSHKLAIYAEKHLRFTKDVRTNHAKVRGYSDAELMNPIYVDTQGRRYNTAVAVDFHATRRYIDPDSNTWVARKPEGMRVDEFENRKKS